MSDGSVELPRGHSASGRRGAGQGRRSRRKAAEAAAQNVLRISAARRVFISSCLLLIFRSRARDQGTGGRSEQQWGIRRRRSRGGGCWGWRQQQQQQQQQRQQEQGKNKDVSEKSTTR